MLVRLLDARNQADRLDLRRLEGQLELSAMVLEHWRKEAGQADGTEWKHDPAHVASLEDRLKQVADERDGAVTGLADAGAEIKRLRADLVAARRDRDNLDAGLRRLKAVTATQDDMAERAGDQAEQTVMEMRSQIHRLQETNSSYMQTIATLQTERKGWWEARSVLERRIQELVRERADERRIREILRAKDAIPVPEWTPPDLMDGRYAHYAHHFNPNEDFADHRTFCMVTGIERPEAMSDEERRALWRARMSGIAAGVLNQPETVPNGWDWPHEGHTRPSGTDFPHPH